MKYILLLTSLFISGNLILSQDKFEDWFKNPLEQEREYTPPPPIVPVNTNPSPSLFFNINISQQSAPQNEPSVGISRKDPNKVVAAWRDFRYGVDPSANRRVGYSYSTNGGLTWSISQLLDSTLLPGLTRNSDPVITTDTAGNFYIAVIAIAFPSGNLTLAVYKSTNGGVTFPNAYIASQTGTEDKEWITSDLSPVSPYFNSLYISWTSFSLGGLIQFVKSTNGGVNWSSPVAVSNSSNVQGSWLCVDRTGNIYVSWLGYGANANVMFDKSTNGGTSFGTDITVASGTPPSGLPNNVSSFPTIDVDRSTGSRSGWIYITFADNRNGDCDIFFTRSSNGGANWSTPLRVNNDPIGNGKIQYWPSVAVNETGNIAILFMDTRNTPNNTIIEAYIARSLDGGNTFTNELVSSDQSPTNIPGSNVRFGDYIDIDYLGQNVIPVWTDERAGGTNMDIYTSEITELLGTEPISNIIPSEFVLHQNYPNPFNPVTKIKFGVPKSAKVTIKIFDVIGREVANLLDENLQAGLYEVEWSATGGANNFASGVFFYTMTAGDYKSTRKMILLK